MHDIRTISLATLLEQGKALLAENHAESGFGYARIDTELFQKVEDAGKLTVLGLYVEDKLVGYCATVHGEHPMAEGKVCTAVVLFVTKSMRGNDRGRALFDATVERARELGAAYSLWHARSGMRIEDLLKRWGCVPFETVLLKES